MNVKSTRFGMLEVKEEDTLYFPEGIPGVETVQEYCLVPHAPDSPFTWLQAVSLPSLAFVLVDPFPFYPHYDLTISDADVEALGLQGIEDVRVYVIVTFSAAGLTANLVGPIVVNTRTRCARQLIISNGKYSCRHALGEPMPVLQQAAS